MILSQIYVKVLTKYLDRHTKMYVRQLHAKKDTLAWYNGLDAFLYLKRFMKTYLCL
jgi:hypothetical protein